MTVDLRFRAPSHTGGNPVDLTFGEDESIPFDNRLRFNIAAPPLRAVSVRLVPKLAIEFNISLPLFRSVDVDLAYDLAVTTGPQSRTVASWQVAGHKTSSAKDRFQSSAPLKPYRRAPWGTGTHRRPEAGSSWAVGTPRRRSVVLVYQEATRRPAEHGSRWQETSRVARPIRQAPWQEATPIPAKTYRSPWQEMDHYRRPLSTMSWQEAHLQEKSWLQPWQGAVPRAWSRVAPWGEAMHPLPGKSHITPPVIPPDEPCYIPPNGLHVDLLFRDRWDGTGNLIFTCEMHDPTNPPLVVVPVRSVYMIVNTTSLRRVSDNALIPCSGMSLSVDVDSWTWSFSAAVPASAEALLEPVDGAPRLLKMSINGADYHVYCEDMERDRVFGRSDLRIRGRGRSSGLDAPWSPVLNLSNSEDRTAQQLMADALLDNGEPIGWDLDFQLADWLVPAGAWSFQGSRIEAINRIAAAAGGYVQPHATADQLIILPRYPIAPWNWLADAVPDFELPSAVAIREGITWKQKANYNRVFVSGAAAGGILGQITITGTAGDVLAPMVTDSLITHVDAARQRGTAVLSDTGRQAAVSLRTPVLFETGVIRPGKFVKYVDGATMRFGIVRSTSVEVDKHTVWQTLGVETHV